MAWPPNLAHCGGGPPELKHVSFFYFAPSPKRTCRNAPTSLGRAKCNLYVTTNIRRLLGTVLTTYIPTILLIIISYFSNFFKPFFFEVSDWFQYPHSNILRRPWLWTWQSCWCLSQCWSRCLRAFPKPPTSRWLMCGWSLSSSSPSLKFSCTLPLISLGLTMKKR